MRVKDHPLSNQIPEALWPLMEPRDSAPIVIDELKKMFSKAAVAAQGAELAAWEGVAFYYMETQSLHQALLVMSELYNQLISYQNDNNIRVHKGRPLVWMRDFHLKLGHIVTAKRFGMLTLCEDAILYKGNMDVAQVGIYFRLAYDHGLSDSEIKRYAKLLYDISQRHPAESFYPEWLLQEIDNNWMTEYPSSQEAFLYVPNRLYISDLLSKIGDGTGLILERLADYLLSVIPGFRTNRRQRTPSTDYDIVCSIEGLAPDFRSELGRYIICECKDWSRPADFTTMAKFSRVLDSTKCKGGILFSSSGISGDTETRYAARERLKIFQDRSLAILDLNKDDLESLSRTENLITLLRKKYEQVRLDLAKGQ